MILIGEVAAKCCVSIRTVRREMQTLVDRGLLRSEQRYRMDGSCSSNRYRLLLEGGDKLSPAPDACGTTPVTGAGSPDSGDIPGTTIGTHKESPPPQGTTTAAVVLSSVESSGGELSDLEYPKTLSVAERFVSPG